jgi:hypothetical protein
MTPLTYCRASLSAFILASWVIVPWLLAWNNGGSTNQVAECSNPPYATHVFQKRLLLY